MAKPSEATPQRPQNGKPALPPLPVTNPPPPKPEARLLTVKHLDVVRHGNDEYTVTELTLSGTPKGPFAVTASKVLKANCTAHVAQAWCRSWYLETGGPNLTGPYWR